MIEFRNNIEVDIGKLFFLIGVFGLFMLVGISLLRLVVGSVWMRLWFVWKWFVWLSRFFRVF